MYDLGEHFKIDIMKSKTPASYVYRGKNYRFSILSDTLIRLEYSDAGTFNDYPTFFAQNRSFGKPRVEIVEDENILIIRNENFVLEYRKNKNFIGTKLIPEQNLKVTITNTDKFWYFNHPEARNFKGTGYSLDDMNGSVFL